ncbi:Two-component response regulator ARR11 [Acorus calamus]|uniref:Two-component response regulator ARR11 n=1 Tax=Acorus calamus TaxID=4465 RepID=A0AAV9CXZ9_ACOCL|nr:Two-component response regulator ARR11 [Acorus calamus]
MSVDGETSRVMKGVQHGACDYLLKPIRMKELRNIWQHVFRKRIHEVKEMEIHDINDDIYGMRSLYDEYDERKLFNGEVGPKKILDLMNVPGQTRENVASHLQLKRDNLRRDS